ncbi:MAG: hypothetical protein N3D82_03485 [Ignisphaera sp.]|nr:hypothetical protein [Ignisphaera sp.]
MVRRGQSELVSTIIYIGLALVIGIAMLSYFTSVVAGYRESILLSSHLASEASNVLVSTISFDNRSSTLWLLLKRVDGSRGSFFIAVEDGLQYLPCSSISFYNPYSDEDGVLCNSLNDCPGSSRMYEGSMDGVYIPWEGSVSSFRQYAKSMGYTIANPVRICTVENICRYSPAPGLCTESTIVRVKLSREASRVRTLIVAPYGGRPYVVGVYEVTLR